MNIMIKEEFAHGIDESLLIRTVQAVLTHEGKAEQTDLSIVIDDDDRLQELNSQFLGIDSPTDVLSFPSGEIDPESGEPYLGDIIISFPRAMAQATEAGHSPLAEVQLLLVHGVLHLLGYDHAENEEKEAMWEAQNTILEQLGVPLNRFPQ